MNQEVVYCLALKCSALLTPRVTGTGLPSYHSDKRRQNLGVGAEGKDWVSEIPCLSFPDWTWPKDLSLSLSGLFQWHSDHGSCFILLFYTLCMPVILFSYLALGIFVSPSWGVCAKGSLGRLSLHVVSVSWKNEWIKIFVYSFINSLMPTVY